MLIVPMLDLELTCPMAKASQVKKGGSVPLQLLSDDLLFFESLLSKVSGHSLFTFIIF